MRPTVKVVRREIANKTLTVHIHLHMNIYRSYTLMCDFSNILFHHAIFRFLRWVTLFWYPWVSQGHSRLPTWYTLWLRVEQHSPEQILICHCLNDILYIIVRRAGLLWSQQDFEWRWSVPLFKCLTVLEFSFILFDLCLLITFFNFIMNYVPIVTFWIFTYHKIWILSIMFCFIWSYWIIYFLACLEVSWRVVS